MHKKKISDEFPKEAKQEIRADALPAFRGMTGKLLTAALIAAMAVSAGLVLYIVMVPHQNEQFTEFYILGPDGKADNYPASFGPGEQKPVRVGIVNHENAYSTYDLVVALNDSKGLTALYEEKIGLDNNGTWEKAVLLEPDRAGNGMLIEFLLYKGDSRSAPYRDLYLRVNVTG